MGELYGSCDVCSISICLAHCSHKGSFDKISKYLEIAKGNGYEIIAGGKGYLTHGILLIIVDDSEGFFVWPTVVVSKDPKSPLMTEEIFGPILTVHLI